MEVSTLLREYPMVEVWRRAENCVCRDRRKDYPDLIHMTSTGLGANGEPGNAEKRKPKGDEVSVKSNIDAGCDM
jgi:hypothetical protein